MKRMWMFGIACSLFFVLMTACSGGETPADDKKIDEKMGEVVKHYAALVFASYEAVDKGLVELQKAINDFVAKPSKDGLENAKKKWLAVRDVYGQTEVFRFYSGPIDDDAGLEGRLNAWPLDENYVDYVKDKPESGIINDLKAYPTIDKKLLVSLNEKDGEKNISIGFHAIEFLLWGQDLDAKTPGVRPYTDFVEGKDGTAKNQKRRGQYLKLVMEILLEDLRTVKKQWEAGQAGNFRDKWEKGDAKANLTKILTGMGTLSGGELSGERMTTPYKEKDQEEEHSCFSDNTKADIVANAQGIQNVFLGTFGSTKGASIYDLIKLKDAKLADKLKGEIEASMTAVKAIPEPFDQAIVGADDAEGRKKVKAAIDALRAQTTTTADGGKLFGLTVNTEIPE